MNALQFKSRIVDAENYAGSSAYRSRCYDALKDFQRCHCYNPQKVRVFLSAEGVSKTLEVPCGYCYHCRKTKQNEWTTRAYAHAEFYKNVYFVTLTYRSFYPSHLLDGSPMSYLFNYLKGCAWILDSNNKLGHLCYSPSVLYKPHYQNFIKRLRKNTGLSDLSYMICGEYGHTYGRPHFHLILFTNGCLTINDIKRAWSLSLVFDNRSNSFVAARNSHSLSKRIYSFGKVSFDDLVKNGSFDEHHSVSVDGLSLNAGNCFAYVCKYLHKDEYNSIRVSAAFNAYIKTQKENKLFDLLKFQNKQLSLYDKVENSHKNFEVVPPSDSESLSAFIRCFRPFFRVSLGRPIGSDYVKTHITEMADGQYSKPSLQAKGFVVPSYFRRKVSEYLFPYRKISSSKLSKCLVKQNLPLLCLNLKKALASNNFVGLGVSYSVGNDIDFLLRKSRFAFVDLTTRERSLICYDAFGSVWVDCYKYDKNLRKYIKVRERTILEFTNDYIERFLCIREQYDLFMQIKKQHDFAFEVAKCLINQYLDFNDLSLKVVTDLENSIKYVQNYYNINHNHID